MGKINVQEGYRAIMKDYMSIYEEWLKNPYFDEATKALNQGASVESLVKLPVREQIGRFKYTPDEEMEREYNNVLHQLQSEIANLLNRKEEE